MKKKSIYSLVIVLSITLFSCSKDDGEIIQEPAKSSAKQITSFVFKASENDALTEDITAVINEQNKTISAAVPNGTTITSLNPTVQFSEKATVGQTGAKDFSSPIDYTITAEDGTKAVYKTTVSIAPSNAKQLISFAFKNENNELYGDETITAIIDEINKTITATVSYSANAALLTPSIEVSSDASVSPNVAQDFSNPVVYTVTAEDGTTIDYQVTLEITFTDRDALIAIFNANPNNTLGWDLNDTAFYNWNGVALDIEDRVHVLRIASKQLTVIPSEIGRLSNLFSLFINNNKLTDLPPELSELPNLHYISIGYNNFNTIPTTVWQLTNLSGLNLNGLNLSSLPSEIGNLSSLNQLNLSDNQLNALPDELAQLSGLQILYLSTNNFTEIPAVIYAFLRLHLLHLNNNKLTFIPTQIEELTNLLDLFLRDNSISVIPSNISKLTSLKKLYLDNNDVRSISSSIGLLTNLEQLSFNGNDLTSVPKEIANLQNLDLLDLTINPDLLAISVEICNLANSGTDVRLDSQTTCQ